MPRVMSFLSLVNLGISPLPASHDAREMAGEGDGEAGGKQKSGSKIWSTS